MINQYMGVALIYFPGGILKKARELHRYDLQTPLSPVCVLRSSKVQTLDFPLLLVDTCLKFFEPWKIQVHKIIQIIDFYAGTSYQ